MHVRSSCNFWNLLWSYSNSTHGVLHFHDSRTCKEPKVRNVAKNDLSQACFNCLCSVFWFSATCGLSGIEIGSLELILWFWIVSWCITWAFGLDDVCFSNLSGWIGGLCAICSLYYYLMISCPFSISYVYLLLELVSLWDYDWFRKLRIDGIKLEMHFPLF